MQTCGRLALFGALLASGVAMAADSGGRPNVVLILTDNHSAWTLGCYGNKDIRTPNIDRLAAEGMRFDRCFTCNAVCSPTRAALLTGHNHHSVATGVVVDQATGFPGYDSVIPRDAVGIGEILRLNGYDTSWYGKDHNVPQWVASQAGPFTDWPTGPIKGFDYYYGFLGDDTSQWQPNNLFRNTTAIYPYVGKPGWNLITAMADDAIHWLNQLNDIDPSAPFFLHYVPGATHAPHHPTPEWINKISAMHLFDDGYDKLRERIFENQKRLGVIPKDTKLTPWPKELLKPWDQLSAEEKKLFIRQVEIFAAYAAYSDHEIGRVIQAFDDLGKLDNTLIIYINGDNGTSAEGGPLGTPNEVAFFNGVNMMPVATQMKWYDE